MLCIHPQGKLQGKVDRFWKFLLSVGKACLHPLETVKKMKKVIVEGKETMEPQDNWRMVYEEVLALSSSVKHRDFLNTIINNDLKRFALYFVDDSLLHTVKRI